MSEEMVRYEVLLADYYDRELTKSMEVLNNVHLGVKVNSGDIKRAYVTTTNIHNYFVHHRFQLVELFLKQVNIEPVKKKLAELVGQYKEATPLLQDIYTEEVTIPVYNRDKVIDKLELGMHELEIKKLEYMRIYSERFFDRLERLMTRYDKIGVAIEKLLDVIDTYKESMLEIHYIEAMQALKDIHKEIPE
jgi:hypothetical protein